MSSPVPKILVDAVFFQYNRSGIARVWRSLWAAWVRDGFACQVLVLDRAGTAPRIEGLNYRVIPAHDYARPGQDRALLQSLCDEENACLFVSTYYTIPVSTLSVFLAYDMIPEVMNWDFKTNAMWREKQAAIVHARSFITISQNTANDLRRFYAALVDDRITVAHCGVDFTRPEEGDVAAFKARHDITRPYFLLVGSRGDYKNAALFFKAFGRLGDERARYAIVCTGPVTTLEPEFAAHVGAAQVHMLEIDDAGLQCAYAGALALAYPSMYEGFGMPIIEAMACGCPVITCCTSSIPEVAGDAALYVPVEGVDAMQAALQQVQLPAVRADLVAKGVQQAALFSWAGMAEKVKQVLLAEATPGITASASANESANESVNASDVAAGALVAPRTGLAANMLADPFYATLCMLAVRPDLKTFLDIGGDEGFAGGHALAEAVLARADMAGVTVFCLERRAAACEALKARHAAHPQVHVWHLPSVAPEEYPSDQAVTYFYQTATTTLNTQRIDQVIARLRQDRDQLRLARLTEGGIERVKAASGIQQFDLVVIDGSEFTGEAELLHCLGARVIVLNGVNAHRCFNAYRMLASHIAYQLVQQNLQLRTGYAVFERRF